MQKQRGEAWFIFYHVNDVSVYLVDGGGGEGGGSPIEETSLRPYYMYLVVSAPRDGVSNIHKVKTPGSKWKNTCVECVVSMVDPSPSLFT